jgi:hypothetical protein
MERHHRERGIGMSKLNALLERMAELIGISTDYTDAFGKSVETSPETRNSLLAALGLNTASENEARESLARLVLFQPSSPSPRIARPSLPCAEKPTKPAGRSQKRMERGMKEGLQRTKQHCSFLPCPWAIIICNSAHARRR